MRILQLLKIMREILIEVREQLLLVPQFGKHLSTAVYVKLRQLIYRTAPEIIVEELKIIPVAVSHVLPEINHHFRRKRLCRIPAAAS